MRKKTSSNIPTGETDDNEKVKSVNISSGASTTISNEQLASSNFLPSGIQSDNDIFMSFPAAKNPFTPIPDGINVTDKSLFSNSVPPEGFELGSSEFNQISDPNLTLNAIIRTATGALQTVTKGSLAGNVISEVKSQINDVLSTALPGRDTKDVDIITGELAPNILDDLENYTYNFKLALVPETQILKGDSSPISKDAVIVAQSGKSAQYIINDVQIESYVGMNWKTKNSTAWLFNIEIVEPQGFTFIDKLLVQGSKPPLNIKNVYIFPMVLELVFKGFDENGTQKQRIRKTWKLYLTKMETHLEHGGAKYNLTFAVNNDYGWHRVGNSSAILKRNITIAAETVGEFFDELGAELTRLDSVTVAPSDGDVTRLSAHEYEFNVAKEIAKWKIGGKAMDQENVHSTQVDEVKAKSGIRDPSKRIVMLEEGEKLEDIVDRILGSTEEFIEKMNPVPKDGDNRLKEPQGSGPAGKEVSQVGRVTATNDILRYNRNNNEYVRKFIYHITLYDQFTLSHVEPNYKDNESRLRYMINSNALKKRYNYMFTGKNTDVLNMDLTLNYLWVNAISHMNSSRFRNTEISSSILKHEDVANAASTGDPTNSRKLSAADQIPLPAGLSPDIFPIRPDPKLIEINSPFVDKIIKDFLKSDPIDQLIGEIPIPKAIDFINRIPAKEIFFEGIDKTVDQISNTISQIIPVEGDNIKDFINEFFPDQNPGSRFESPFKGNSNLNPTLLEEFEFVQQDDFIKDLMYQQQVDPAIDARVSQSGISITKDEGRAVVETLFNQMYSRPTGDLMIVDLEIRGDPYWLGESDAEQIRRVKAKETQLKILNENISFANFVQGENLVFLSFKTPTKFNENTGVPELEESTTFLGVYGVVTVTSNFSNGKFTQVLNLKRELNVKADAIKSILKKLGKN